MGVLKNIRAGLLLEASLKRKEWTMTRYTTIRSIISLATTQGWNLHQMDVKSAFLHGSLKEEVYVE